MNSKSGFRNKKLKNTDTWINGTFLKLKSAANVRLKIYFPSCIVISRQGTSKSKTTNDFFCALIVTRSLTGLWLSSLLSVSCAIHLHAPVGTLPRSLLPGNSSRLPPEQFLTIDGASTMSDVSEDSFQHFGRCSKTHCSLAPFARSCRHIDDGLYHNLSR